MKIKIILPLFVLFAILMSCTKEVVKKPDNLIDKDKMVDIMYDISLLSAIKIQSSSSSDAESINSNEFINKKYKIDSLQFVQSNIYYAADAKDYANMVGEIKKRLDSKTIVLERLVKIQSKKELLIKKKQEKLKQIRIKDSIAKVNKGIKNETDSIKKFQFIDPHWSLYIDEYLKTPYLRRF